jgi:NTE family protein
MTRKKKIGIALGGGGARGLAHIGVLKAILEAGIKPDIIVGTSMGSIVGGWYAAGHSLEELEKFFLKIEEKNILSSVRIIYRRDGVLFNDPSIQKEIEDKLAHRQVEKCEIKFAAIATDVSSGEEVVLDSGSMVTALKASSSLPLAFKPVKIGEKLLVDGAFSNPVPADVAKRMGADIVIAVDVSSRWVNFSEQEIKIRKIPSIIENSVQAAEYQLAKEHTKEANIILRPLVTQFNWLDFAAADKIISAGYAEARSNLKKLAEISNTKLPEKSPFEKFMDFILYQRD